MIVNELRIGNYLKVGNTEANVDAINFDYVHLQGNAITNRIDMLKPIPLTEEWLLKFGFKKQNTYGSSNLWSKKTPKGFYFNFFEQPKGVCEGSKGSGTWVIQNGEIGYKYVHQLQNLFFALTGEELKL